MGKTDSFNILFNKLSSNEKREVEKFVQQILNRKQKTLRKQGLRKLLNLSLWSDADIENLKKIKMEINS